MDIAALIFLRSFQAALILIATYFAALLFRWWLRRALIWVSQFFPDDEEEPADYRDKARALSELGYWAVFALGSLWAGWIVVRSVLQALNKIG